MSEIDLKDERFAKLYGELQSCLNKDEEVEVFVFDHTGGESQEISTRTVIIDWDADQYLVIQSHYWHDESTPSVVRLPHAAVKFMCSDILERSIHATGFHVGPNGDPKRLRHLDWAAE